MLITWVRYLRHMPAYDKGGRLHQALISALQKSIRGSDANAALYWLARLLNVGVPLEIIARRLLAIALEDIGMADTQALLQAIAAKDAVELLAHLAKQHLHNVLFALPQNRTSYR